MSGPEPHLGDRIRRQYSFGAFTLDPDRKILRCAEQEIALRPKSLDVLIYLVEHHGDVVGKPALMDAVWGETAVTENSLAQCLVEIRRALNDDSQQLVRTVARRGYMFAAPVMTPLLDFPRQETVAPAEARPFLAPARRRGSRRLYLLAVAALVLSVAGGLAVLRLNPPARRETVYTQITNFPDSAIAPALSPDGRLVAFLRSERWFMSRDQIYIKMLPDGDPVQLTRDPRQKYGIAFSPDGSRLFYTAVDRNPMGWNTYAVPVLGGEPSLVLSNASGLTWLGPNRLLFSEQDGKGAAHMGIVSATINRADYRPIYFPPHERSMAHFSYASPDHKWILVAEMDPVWHRCRIVPMDGSSSGREVGPNGSCTSAGWSPDGKWMYFGAEVNGSHHLWRQRFPQGEPEQVTHGTTQEDGVAVAPDGRSLITSVGIDRDAIWVHDPRGERMLYSEGYVEGMLRRPLSSLRFSSDGRSIFYLMRRDSPQSPSELWRTDLTSGRYEAVLRGVSIGEYDLSSDDREIVFSTERSEKQREIWLAPLDRSLPPRLVTASGGRWPVFGPDNDILFQWSDGTTNYLVRIRRDGSGQSKVVPDFIGNINGISPDRRWIAVLRGKTVAIPTTGGAPREICQYSTTSARWSADGRWLYVGLRMSTLEDNGTTVALPVPPGESLPHLPPGGIRDIEHAKTLPGTRILPRWDIAPGPDPSVFAYTKTTVHRNLYRIPLP